MMYELPTSLNVCGVEYAIRSDYRAALDVLSVFSAVDLDNGVLNAKSSIIHSPRSSFS
jgi:hypothetical protein